MTTLGDVQIFDLLRYTVESHGISGVMVQSRCVIKSHIEGFFAIYLPRLLYISSIALQLSTDVFLERARGNRNLILYLMILGIVQILSLT